MTPSCGRRSTPNSRRSNRPTATPAPRSTCCWPTPSSQRWRGNGQGIGGCRRSVSTSTTTRCSTGCTSCRCVRPPMGSHCHPKRCAAWPVKQRSCRSCSTAPAKSSTAAASVRVANRAQRRALRAMYRTCGYPGCDVTFDRCDIHHVIEWLRHGATDLDNLLPLVLETSPSGPRRTLATRPSTNTG